MTGSSSRGTARSASDPGQPRGRSTERSQAQQHQPRAQRGAGQNEPPSDDQERHQQLVEPPVLETAGMGDQNIHGGAGGGVTDPDGAKMLLLVCQAEEDRFAALGRFNLLEVPEESGLLAAARDAGDQVGVRPVGP